MANKHTLEELNNLSREQLITIALMMQGQMDALNENIEKLIEQVRIAKQSRKKKGQRNLDLKDFPEEILPPYSVSREQMDAFYREGNWRRM